MLKHISNGYVAKEIFNKSLPKVKKDEQTAQQFKDGFNLSSNAMRFAGIIELIGSILLFMSIFGKRFVRVGAIMINIVLGVAIFKHLKAGHGLKGSKGALKFFGLNILNFMESMRK